MENKSPEIFEILFQISSILFAAIPVYFLFKTSPKEITNQALIIFGIMVGVFILTIIFSFVYNKYKKMSEDIQYNKNAMEEIKKDLNMKDVFSKFDVRLGIIEGLFKMKNKRGSFAIDPRYYGCYY